MAGARPINPVEAARLLRLRDWGLVLVTVGGMTPGRRCKLTERTIRCVQFVGVCPPGDPRGCQEFLSTRGMERRPQ